MTIRAPLFTRIWAKESRVLVDSISSPSSDFQLYKQDPLPTVLRGKDQPNPRGAQRNVSDLTCVAVLATSLLTGVLQGMPFHQGDWPVPKGPAQGSITQKTLAHNNVPYIGLDKFPNGAGGAHQTDWPVPKGPLQGGITQKTWTWNNVLYIGKDKFPNGVGGANQFDWPVPKGPTQGSISLKTWTQNTQFQLIGKDTFFGAGGANQFDWPNPPLGAQRSIDLRTHIAIPMPAKVPFIQTEWPVPKGPIAGITLRTWAPNSPVQLTTSFTMPFRQADWPVPKGYPPRQDRIDYLSFQLANDLPPGLVGGGAAQFDWPNPQGQRPRSVSLLTWTQSVFVSSQPVVTVPFLNFDCPVPKGSVPGVTLKTWTNNQTYLLGKDAVTAGGFAKDWPNPRGPAPHKPQQSRRVINTTSQDVIYGAPGQAPTYDWQNPKLRTPASVETLGGSRGTNYILPTVNPIPYNQLDWPNPRGYVPVISLKTWTDNHVIYLGKDTFFGVGGPRYDWPNPRGYSRNVELLGGSKPAGPGMAGVKITVYDWPNPRGPVPNIALRTWLNPTNLEDLTQASNLPQQNNYQWPNPTIRRPASTDALSWYQSLRLAAQPISAPTGRDFPNPRGPVYNVSLRTWIDQTKINLIGKDKFFGLGGPSYDWPNPRGSASLVNRTGISFVLPLPIPPHVTPPSGPVQFGGGTGLIFPDAEESIGMLQPTAAEIFGDEEVGYDERLVVLLRQLLQLENDNRERQTREYEDDRAALHNLIRNAYLGIVERDKVPPPGWTAGGPWEPPFHPMDDRRIAAHLKVLTDFLDKIRNDARLAAIEEDDADVWMLMG